MEAITQSQNTKLSKSRLKSARKWHCACKSRFVVICCM